MQSDPAKAVSGRAAISVQTYQTSGDALQNEAASQSSQERRYDGNSTLLLQPRQSFVQPLIVDETKNYMEGIHQDDDDDSDCELKDDKTGQGNGQQFGPDGQPIRTKKTRGRVKIKMEFIQNKLRRYTTFSKRKTGIMKKAYELSTLTGTQVMLLVASETGHVYTFATRKLQPMITSESGKALIQTCLNSPDPTPPHVQVGSSQTLQETLPGPVTLPSDQRMSQHGYQETDLQYSNTEEDVKVTQVGPGPGSIRYVIAGQTFPMTTLVAQPSNVLTAKNSSAPVTYAVQPVGGGSSITTFFAPGMAANVASNIQVHTQPIATTHAPQILTGQLQLHRIHPQNIILTGKAPAIQDGHVILNSPPPVASSAIPLVITQSAHPGLESSTSQQKRSSSSGIAVGPHELITLVNSAPSNVGHQPQMHVVYNPVSGAGGGVIFASSQGSSAIAHSVNTTQARTTDGASLQHTPVIQTPGNVYQHDGGSVQRHMVGEALVNRSSGHPGHTSRK